jgi:Zn-dependent metalloprotease
VAPHEKALRSQYQIDRLRVPEESGQIKGYFSVLGDLTSPTRSQQAGNTGPEARRATAAQFFIENQELFGLQDPATDLHEYSLRTDPTSERTHITYHRYVGPLRLKEMTIQVHLEADGSISAVSGHIVPVPVASETAVANLGSALTESEIRARIESDLEAQGVASSEIASMEVARFAKTTDPYVVWDADVLLSEGPGTWVYQLDAFTGDVLLRRFQVQHFRHEPVGKATPGRTDVLSDAAAGAIGTRAEAAR